MILLTSGQSDGGTTVGFVADVFVGDDAETATETEVGDVRCVPRRVASVTGHGAAYVDLLFQLIVIIIIVVCVWLGFFRIL